MKITKVYLRIQYDSTTHQMVRVDNIKEFREIINSKEFASFIKTIQQQVYFKSLSEDEKDKKMKIVPFEIIVEDSIFLKMNKEINRKLNSANSIPFLEFNLVLHSKNLPIIKIKKQVNVKSRINN